LNSVRLSPAPRVFVLGSISSEQRLGRYFPDGLLLSNVDADLTAQPDGTFVFQASLQAGCMHFVEGAQEGFVELEGTPDMVLEVLSASSEEKDTMTLRDLYWQARISVLLVGGRPGRSTAAGDPATYG
jgi:hypothetical protein